MFRMGRGRAWLSSLSHSLRDAGQWAGPIPEPLSALGSQLLSWKEENSTDGDGKGKNRFGASFSHPISSTPTAMVSAAQAKPNAEDSHGKAGGVKPLSIPKVSPKGQEAAVMSPDLQT